MNPYSDESFCKYAIDTLSPHPDGISYKLTEKIVNNSSQTVKQLLTNFNKKINKWKK